MSTIGTIEIGTNRYAPAGSEAINLYSTEGASQLTLGQLMVAVCMRSAAVYEEQSVLKMNSMTAGSAKLKDSASWLGKIADGSADWGQAKDFLVSTMSIPESSLPDKLDSYDKRMQAASALKSVMDNLSQTQQQAMVDLQSIVNRRDVAHSTASNVVRSFATSLAADAANFR